MSYPHKPQHSSELAPLESAGIFQSVAEVANVGILIIDACSRIEFANSMVSELIGHNVDSLLGQNFTDFLDESNRKLFQALKEKSDTYASRLYQGIEIITAYATPVITEMCFANYERQSGETKYFIFLREISARWHLTKELRETGKRYREIFDRVDQGIFISSKEGKFLNCNAALLKILGYDNKEELLQIDIFKDVYASEDDRLTYQRLMEQEGFVKNYEVEWKKKSGERIPVLLTTHVIRDENDEVLGYQGLTIDISERIRMERELAEKNRFFSNLLESSVDCIVAADMRGRVIFFNKAAEKLTGYKAEEVIGKVHITKFYPLEVAKDVMQKLRSDDFGGRGKLENFRIKINGKNGEEIPVRCNASVIYEGDRELASLGIFTDLREMIKMEKALKETQARLVQAEKLASLGSLAAGVAHEINNPLGGILIYASLLMEEFAAEDDPRVQDLKRIVEEGSRCKEIVRSLLEFGRQTESTLELVDINKAINDGLFFLEHQAIFHDVKIVKNLDPSLPLVQGNQNQLKQVFMNIMVNGAEAMSDEGGTLTITTGTSPDASSIFIAFHDTGMGISREIQSKIFDPFFTTKGLGKGTGLGLSTSYGIIQNHHGNIEVESESGKGTTFTVVLPTSIEEI